MFPLGFRTCQADGQQLDMQILAVCVVYLSRSRKQSAWRLALGLLARQTDGFTDCLFVIMIQPLGYSYALAIPPTRNFVRDPPRPLTRSLDAFLVGSRPSMTPFLAACGLWRRHGPATRPLHPSPQSEIAEPD